MKYSVVTASAVSVRFSLREICILRGGIHDCLEIFHFVLQELGELYTTGSIDLFALDCNNLEDLRAKLSFLGSSARRRGQGNSFYDEHTPVMRIQNLLGANYFDLQLSAAAVRSLYKSIRSVLHSLDDDIEFRCRNGHERSEALVLADELQELFEEMTNLRWPFKMA